MTVAADDKVAILNELLLWVHQLRTGKSVAFSLRRLQKGQRFCAVRECFSFRRPIFGMIRQGRGRPARPRASSLESDGVVHLLHGTLYIRSSIRLTVETDNVKEVPRYNE